MLTKYKQVCSICIWNMIRLDKICLFIHGCVGLIEETLKKNFYFNSVSLRLHTNQFEKNHKWQNKKWSHSLATKVVSK